MDLPEYHRRKENSHSHHKRRVHCSVLCPEGQDQIQVPLSETMHNTRSALINIGQRDIQVTNNQLKLYRTVELSAHQIEGICSLFEETFHKIKTPEQFLRQFSNTGFPGGSYHVISEDNGVVLATFSFIPYRYNVRGSLTKCVLGSDLIVSPKINLGIGGILKMYKLAVQALKKDDFQFLYGFPNDNMYDYDKKIMRMKDVCIFDFYVLPINLTKIKKWFILLQWLYYPCVWIVLHMLCLLSSKKVVSYPIEKVDDEQFRNSRYDDRHHFVKIDDNTEAVYTIYQEGDLSVAYIVDFTPISPWSFYRTFIRVSALTKNDAAIVAYPANRLPFFTPLRVPQRFLPRKLYTVVIEFDNPKSDSLANAKEWNINLSNTDVR